MNDSSTLAQEPAADSAPTTDFHIGNQQDATTGGATAAPSVSVAQALASQQKLLEEHKPKRTAGLWAVDALLYPIFNNFSVFVLSTVATYLTTHGNPDKFFRKRGDATQRLYEKFLDPVSADMAKKVTWSFLDGSVIGLAVKLLEDQRKPIAKWLDRQFGTEPPNDVPYDAEPKQTWGSVALSRGATAGIVVPVAISLGKRGLNDKVFDKPAAKLATWITAHPKVARMAGKWDINNLSYMLVFEAVYTSICTAGFYLGNRLFGNKAEEVQPIPPITHFQLPAPASSSPAAAPDASRPAARIEQAALAGRVNTPLEHAQSAG